MKSVWEEELYFSYGYVSALLLLCYAECIHALLTAAAFYNALDAGAY
jgi:hypothetical protein